MRPPAYVPVGGAVPPLRALGQIGPLSIAVVDVNGKPVADATVEVRFRGGSAEGVTDASGVFFAPLPDVSGSVEISAIKDGYGTIKTADAAEGRKSTIFVEIPVCLSQPFLTGVEWGALAAGLALVMGGLYWEFRPAEVVGELLLGAASFNAIYRHSCL